MSHLTPPRQLLDADASAPDPAAGTPAAPAETGTEPDAPSGAHPTDDGAETGARAVEASEPGRGPEAVEDADADTSPGAEEQEEQEDEATGDEEHGEAAGKTSGEAAEETNTSLPAAADDERAPEGTEPHTGPATAADGTEPDSRAAGSGRPGWFGRFRRNPRITTGVRVGTSVLAGAFVLGAILVPDRLDRFSFQTFLRLPVEAVYLSVILLALPSKARRIAAVVTGTLLGLSTVLKCLDMGFYQTLARPFDLVFDWVLLTDAADWVKDSFGHTGEVLAVIGVIVLLVAVLVLSALAMVRLANVLDRHRPAAVSTTLVLGTVWITCFSLGVQFAGIPFATKGYSQFLANRVQYVRDGLGDADVFKKQLAVDAYANTPSDQLLTGLRGKDVLFTFIESYGRVAIDDPAMAPEIDATLNEGNARLKSAGFAAQSGWLRSPVTGAGSWLAHSTFLSGLWINNQQRYRTLTTGDHATLTSYFQKTGAWRTVGIVPGVRKAWPEGKYFGLDHIYDSTHLGYYGPYFSWTPVPDQFSLEAFQKLEHGKKNRDPIMAEIILASSHNPWSPIAHIIDWKDLGNGRIFYKIKKEGTNPTEVWKSAKSVRTEYRKAIQYSLDSLTQWMQRYGDDNTVLVFLGDHQPVPTVTAGSTSRDVPVTIVARDPKVLDRVSGWGWTDGLKPADNAPEWAMNQFRDRFLKAFGPQS
ncbi:sulfatase [Streptomyces hyaluromycini]|uniref:sulfatase n=1 Tax=Streptomyces hyaluromycini TaxID=1377993 RepID=UPI0012380A35|nr:sulfatase [Streptomyces hyaluromycini]